MLTRRGLFGLFAGMSVAPLVKAEAQEPHWQERMTETEWAEVERYYAKQHKTRFPQEAVEEASLRWFNETRGFGYMEGLESGHDLRVTSDVVKDEWVRSWARWRFTVYWKREGGRCVVKEIRGVREATAADFQRSHDERMERLRDAV